MSTQNVVAPVNLGPEFELGTTVANKITINVDGVSVKRDVTTGELSSPAPVVTWNNVTKEITHDDGQGNTQVINLSQFTTDIHVNGGSFNAATSVLTLTDNDGVTPDITIDLSSLLGVSTDAGNILSAGTDGKPYLQLSDISVLATLDLQDAFGVHLCYAFP